MTVKDGELVKRVGWPQGVNNIVREDTVPSDALRSAVNVDLTIDGKPQRRPGYTQRVADASHSLMSFAGHLIAVTDGALTAYDSSWNGTTLVSGFGDAKLSYVEVAGHLYWSDNDRIGRINGLLVAETVWTDAPGQPVATSIAYGGLSAGAYQIAVTYADATGRESGSSIAVLVTVPDGGGIQLSAIPPNTTATTVRVYVSGANGDVLLWARDVPTGVSSVVIGAGQRGKQLETQFCESMPPASILTMYNGRMYAASGNVLRWSPPLAYGLWHPDNFVEVDAAITMLEPAGDKGLFIASDKLSSTEGRTYFASGADPSSWQLGVVQSHGVVPGSSVQVTGKLFGLDVEDDVPYWLSRSGHFCYGTPNGRVVRPTEGRFVAKQQGVEGATILREENGLTQLITSLFGGTVNIMAASDNATATVRRHGITT